MQTLRIFDDTATHNSTDDAEAGLGFLIKPKEGRTGRRNSSAQQGDGQTSEESTSDEETSEEEEEEAAAAATASFPLGEHGWRPKAQSTARATGGVPDTHSLDAASLVEMIVATQTARSAPDARTADSAASETHDLLGRFKSALQGTAEDAGMPLVEVSMTKTAAKTHVTLQLAHLQLYEQPMMLAQLLVFFKYRPHSDTPPTAQAVGAAAPPALGEKGEAGALNKQQQPPPPAGLIDNLEVLVVLVWY
jgi:hypothetical protein